MKAYEPVTLTHMQAYLLQFILETRPNLVSGDWGASSALSDLYEQVKDVPPPTAEDYTVQP